MKTKVILFTTALLVSILAPAHDPKEHAKEGEAPDCQALASMDQGKMDMDDPVMQAMHAKCKEAMQDHGGERGNDTHTDEDAHAMEDNNNNHD